MSNDPNPATRPADTVLAQDFLLARSKILDLAAMLDRLERADGSVAGDPRSTALQHAMEILLDGQGDKASRVQLLMSRPYDPEWRKIHGLH